MTCFPAVRKTRAIDDQFSILFFSKLLTTIKYQDIQLAPDNFQLVAAKNVLEKPAI